MCKSGRGVPQLTVIALEGQTIASGELNKHASHAFSIFSWKHLEHFTNMHFSVLVCQKRNPNKLIKHVCASDVTKCEKVQRVGIRLWGTMKRLPEDCKVMGRSMHTQIIFSHYLFCNKQRVSKPDYVFTAENKTIVDANRQIKFYHRVQHLSECRGIFFKTRASPWVATSVSWGFPQTTH